VLANRPETNPLTELLLTGLLQSPSFRFSGGSIQYKKRVFLKTEYSKLVTTGIFEKVLF
jgi:hypothetical protein